MPATEHHALRRVPARSGALSDHLRQVWPLADADPTELVELSPDAICVHRNGVLTYANRAALDTFAARSADEVVGRRFTDFVAEESQAAVVEKLAGLTGPGAATKPVEALMCRLDGSK